MQRIRKKLSYANVMSSLAVFLVLGGTSALAAGQLGRNSVGSKQLKRNAVTTTKLKRNAVTATKIRAGSVTAAKINNGAVTAAKIKTGAIDAKQLGANSVGNGQTQLVKVFEAGAVQAAPSQAAAPKIELGTVGPFHFYGKCFIDEDKVVEASYIEIASGSATFGSGVDEKAGEFDLLGPGFLTPGTPENERGLAEVDALANEVAEGTGDDFEAAASDGTIITGIASGGAAKHGTVPGGNGPLLAGDSCIVGATVVFGGK